MIDIHIPASLSSAESDEALVRDLTHAVLRAEGVTMPTSFHLENTAAFVHRMPPSAVGTAARCPDDVVRVTITTPPGALHRDGQKQLTKEVTEIIARVVGHSGVTSRTWVVLVEAAEGGWGIAGTAFGKEEFGELARRAAAARSV
jgi:phenylpyruvate tautomerase PptA (4-oxalocrotonate tautomerase family)